MQGEKRALDAHGVVGQEEGPYDVSYTSRDLLIYALGVGSQEMRYLFEGAPGYAAFPTYSLVLPYKGTSTDVVPFPGRTLFLIPKGLRDVVNPGAILHYDQSIHVFEPLDPGGAKLESRSVVLGLYRRRGGALLRTRTTLTDARSGRTMAETTQGTFMRGLEILGDAGPPLPPRPPRPTEPPDVVVSVTIPAQQALLYRLSGDYNAIHADHDAARAAGLEKPILHGLCSLGIAAVQVLRHFCPDDPSGLVSLSCRFSRTVFPGDTLEVKMWGDAAPSRDESCGHHQQSLGIGHDRAGLAGASAAAAAATAAPDTAAAEAGEAEAGGPDGRLSEGGSASKPKVAEEEGEDRQRRKSDRLVESPSISRRTTAAEFNHHRQQHMVVRFEVCSPRQAGAVVVADGRVLLKKRPPLGGSGTVAMGGGGESLRNRARL